MQAELSLELTATSKSEMPKSDVDSKSFLQHSPAWKHAGITRVRRQRPAPQLLLLSYVPTACPQGGRRGQTQRWLQPQCCREVLPTWISHGEADAWGSPVLFPPPEGVAARGDFIKSIGYFSIQCVSVCSGAMNHPDLVITGEPLQHCSLW